MLREFVRILRPGGYLILREHDCKKERSYTAKYLNFIHAIMMISQVGEFANTREDEAVSYDDSSSHSVDWKERKLEIINNTNSIQYRTRIEWQQELEKVGFCLKGTFDYDRSKSGNPQALYYAVFQLNGK